MGAISVNFVVGGVSRVHEAFNSVIKAQKNMERAVASSVANETRARTKGAQSADQIQERRFKALTAQLSKEEKWAASVEKRKTDALVAQARVRDAIVMRSATMAGTIAARQAGEELRARERVERQKLDIQLRSAKSAGRIAEQSVREEAAQRRRFTGSVAGQVIGSARGALGGVARVAGGILALGGGFSAADAVQTSVRNAGKAADLENQSGGKVSSRQILAKSASVGSAMGTSTESVIEGLDAFVAKSGDVKAGFDGIQRLVELAAATGADLGELSRTAGIIHMGTGDIGKTMEQMRTLAGGGRAGSVDMRELSQYAGRISAGANEFANKGTAFAQLSTIVQQAAATGGATAAPEATEAVVRLSSDIFEHEEEFKAKGIKVRDKTGKFLGDPMEIIKASISATGGDTSKLLGMYGKMSYRAVAGYKDIYNRAGTGVTAAGGTKADADKAGLKAIDEAFKKIAGEALSEAQVKTESTKRLQEADKQLEMVLNQLREAVGRELVPELIKLIPEIRRLIPAFTDLLKSIVGLADWFAKNPLSGIGLVVAGAVAKDLALAGIGAAVRSTLIAALSTSLSSIALPIAAMYITAQAVDIWAADSANKQKKDVQDVLSGNNEVLDIAARISAGTATPQDTQRLVAMKGQTQEQIRETELRRNTVNEYGGEGVIGGITAYLGEGLPGVDDAKKSQMGALASTIYGLNDNLSTVNTQLERMAKGLGNATTAATKPTPTPSPKVGGDERTVSGAHPMRQLPSHQ